MSSFRLWAAIACSLTLAVGSPAAARDDRFVVVVDAGHGGVDPGAMFDGVVESERVLSFATELAADLEAAGVAETAMTRRTDEFLPLAERLSRARASAADLVVSIHIEAAPSDANVAGVVLYAPEAASTAALGDSQLVGLECARASRAVADRMAEAIGDVAELAQVRPVRGAPFYILRDCQTPSVVISLGFLTSAEDRARLGDAEWRAAVRGAIVAAIRDWAAE